MVLFIILMELAPLLNKYLKFKLVLVTNKGRVQKVCEKEFKEEVKKIEEKLKANIKDKALYNFIELIVKEDPDLKKWIEEE